MTEPLQELERSHQDSLLAQAWELISPRLTLQRRQRLEHVAKHRTKQVRLVLQDIHDPHNVSACLRSAEALGILHVDQVNLYQKFSKPSSVARGSSRWLQLGRYEELQSYAEQMKAAGIRLAAGYPSSKAVTLAELPTDQPIAVIFGNEHQGVHDDWLPYLDYRFTIPMVGMVESFNISVSAAITMHYLSNKARSELGDAAYYLSEAEQKQLLNQWVLYHSRDPLAELAQLSQQRSKK